MSSIRGVKDRRFNFVQLLNSMFEDQNLSLKAKGFIGYCLTKPENWDFHVEHLRTVLKESDKAIYSTIDECIENGYGYRYRKRDERGRLGPVLYFVSDSKEEIAQIKKEKDGDNDFNKCLPDSRFSQAVAPILQNGEVEFPRENEGSIYSNTDNSNIKNKQQQQQSCIPVVVLPDSPPVGGSPVENSKKIILVDSKNNQTPICRDDLFAQCMLKKKDWIAEEIEKAWEVLKNHKGFVNNWFAFVEGIISNNRKTNKTKQLDKQEEICQKTDSKKEIQSKKPSYNINGVTSEIGMSGLHLANWIPPWKLQTL